MSGVINSGLVSIIVASYNHAEFLEERMDSLIGQTYQNIEILVIDDCSTDNSLEVLSKYQDHPKVKLITRETNGGWVTVSNQGVEMSQGEFIMFANCDDACEAKILEKLVKSIRENPSAGISYCRSKMIDQSGRVLGDDFLIREESFRNLCESDVLIPRDKFRRFLLNSCVIPNLSAALFRKSCYLSSGGMVSLYKICADWDLFFRVVKNNDIAYVVEPLNFFRQHKTTIRNTAKEHVYCGEILSLLLGQISIQNLTIIERLKFRFHVMYLWAIQIVQPSFNGPSVFLHLSIIVINTDPLALILLPLAIMYRVCTFSIKKLKFSF